MAGPVRFVIGDGAADDFIARRVMGAIDSRARIAKAMKELTAAWEQTAHVWRDEQATAFRKRFLDPWEHDVRQAGGAIEYLGHVLNQVRRECE